MCENVCVYVCARACVCACFTTLCICSSGNTPPPLAFLALDRYGEIPYPDIEVKDVFMRVRQGLRLNRPPK